MQICVYVTALYFGSTQPEGNRHHIVVLFKSFAVQLLSQTVLAAAD